MGRLPADLPLWGVLLGTLAQVLAAVEAGHRLARQRQKVHKLETEAPVGAMVSAIRMTCLLSSMTPDAPLAGRSELLAVAIAFSASARPRIGASDYETAKKKILNELTQ